MIRAAAALVLVAEAASAETLRCAPRYPTYCANVHVSCAGRSRIPTQAFGAHFEDDMAHVAFADGTSALFDVSVTHSGRVLRSSLREGWIRIDPKGNFSERIESRFGALFSIGRCEAEK